MSGKYKRFLTDLKQDYNHVIDNARNYVENTKVDNGISPYHYSKPYDRVPGHAEYFRLMYFALNMLQAMNIPQPARILEVGSGSGWLTEILVALGVIVDGIEPSEDFNKLARQRIDAAFQHYRLDHFDRAPRANFHTTTLEECDFPDDSFDGIIFFATLHHIVDEEKGLQKCFRMLKPGGCIGISCEEAWLPANRDQMKIYEEEMANYGTLENPFTKEYLDELLAKNGFAPIVRFHQINGWFPRSMEKQTIIQSAQIPAEFSNCLIAYKPLGDHPTTDSPNAPTAAKIEILDSRFDLTALRLDVKVKLTNSGETTWLHQPKESGWVSIALFQGEIGKTSFLESPYRARLPEMIKPGTSCELTLTYLLPMGYRAENWFVDLVNESYFWFSTRGSVPGMIRFGA